MGWMALFAIAPLSRVLPAAGMFWLIAGGVLYTVGGVLYAVQVARPEQPPLWLPRDLPRLYRPGQRVSLYLDVFRGRSPVTLPETPDPPGHGMAGSFFSFAPGG